MRYLDFIWNEFIHGGHWGSLNASAISLSAMVILKTDIRWELILIAYLGTQCIYNYNHFKELEFDIVSNSPRVNHLRKYLDVLPILTAIYGTIFFSLLIYFGNKLSIFFGGFLLIFGLLFTNKGKDISKKIIGFKSFHASFGWALLIILTAIYCSYHIDLTVFLLFIFVFIRIMINTSFSDIKDLKSDRKKKLLTFPMFFKDKKYYLHLLHIINFMSFIPLWLGVILGMMPYFSLFLFFSLFYSFFYIKKAENKEISVDSLYNVIVDGEYYYWPFLLFIGILIVGY